MPTDLPSLLLLLARIMFGGAFLYFGLRNFRNFQKMRPGMAAKGLPLPDVCLAIGLLMQTVGAAMILFGVLVPVGSAAMVLFLFLAAFLYHPFWKFSGDERTPHLNACITNTALSGGAIALAIPYL